MSECSLPSSLKTVFPSDLKALLLHESGVSVMGIPGEYEGF